MVSSLVGAKIWRIYQRAQVVRANAQELMTQLANPAILTTKDSLAPLLARSRTDTEALRAEADPLLPITDRLGWLPRYGALLNTLRPLLDAAVDLTSAADDTYSTLRPLLQPDTTQPLGALFLQQLTSGHERLLQAQVSLTRADATMVQIPLEALDPELNEPLGRIRQLLPTARAGLELALVAPELLGANTPQTYLVIAQNPDELRATGGLITAAGTVTIDGARMVSTVITDSGTIDDVGQFIYPQPPIPLQRYMGMQMWLFRDANWSPDFPTSARTALELYRLSQGGDARGLIALDPRAIQLLLEAIGPVVVPGQNQPISADTVVAYMHDGTPPSPSDPTPWAIRRKAFLPPLTHALLDRLNSPGELKLPLLAGAIRTMLAERHLQIYLANPQAAAALNRLGWDGALQPGSQDFLLVVDSNLGYNKANMHIAQTIQYSIDLSDITIPTAELKLRYTNQVTQPVACDQASGYRTILEIRRYGELTRGCYWDYLRVYVPARAELRSATEEPVPPTWLDSGISDPGSTEIVDGEAGTRVLGSLLVVPTNATRERSLRYQLPSTIIRSTTHVLHYRLTIQKQAGTPPVPFTLRVIPPEGAALLASSVAPTNRADQALTFTFSLTHDQSLDLSFQMP